ncbi:MAG: hypothetical protein RIC19_22130 [Phaeodactylibacter sp.]|uniref:hypothetical protein n=1 Tax=Phaeodactylibacter sp. TaxID=1940289 RepID=UPI0032EBCC12
MLKPILILTGLLLSACLGFAQNEETVRTIPPEAIQLYPTLEDMHGYAIGQYKDYLLVFGGSIRSKVSEQDYRDFPNLDILLIDFNEKRASAYTNSSFEGSLGEQISATGLSYYQDKGLLYLLGGYGYSETHQQFISFPYITVIDVRQTVLALLNGTDPIASFYQLCDDRMAIFNAEMDFNGDEFFLLNGKSAYKTRPFSNNPQYVEEKFDEEVRTFKMIKDGKEWYLEKFQTWYDLEAFQDLYGTLIPERIEQQLQQIQRSGNLNQ